MLLKSEVSYEQFDIIGLTETWLDNKVDDSELFISGYNFVRKDRGSRGGGVLLYYNERLSLEHRKDLENSCNIYNEIIVCVININNKKIAFVLFYRPPGAGIEFNNNLCYVIDKVKKCNITNICLMGDLNMPGIVWESLTSQDVIEQSLCDIIDQYNLVQCNKYPSRANNGNILDVVFVSKPETIVNLECHDSIVESDHYRLSFTLNYKTKVDVNNITRKVYNFTRANTDELNYYLGKCGLDNIVLSNRDDVNLAWHKWKSKVMSVINKFVPIGIIKNNKASPWIDGEVINLSKHKETARRQAKRSNKEVDWSSYKKINNELKRLVNKKHKEYLDECFDDIDNNPKKFWRVVNCKNNSKCIPENVFLGNECTSDPEMKVKLFNEYFQAQFNKNNYDPPSDCRAFVNNNLGNIVLVENDVYNVLINLNVNKAHGPDDIPTVFYKKCSKSIASSLTLLFNLSLDSGIVPSEWKLANVVPVFKKGNKSDISNYRPISLLPVVGKVLERCVHTHLYSITRNDIVVNQHGFMDRKSTSSQLIEFYDNIFACADQRIQTDVAFLDLTKAFDCVPHNLLLIKLQAFGVYNKLLQWFESYLNNRKQRVVIDGLKSEYCKVLSGVPQGSILGPLLFLYHINDMSRVITDQNTLFMYADDTKIYKQIRSINDCLLFQDSLNQLVMWGNTWGMKFNVNKSCVMTFSRSNTPIMFNYQLNNLDLSRVKEFIDLGITVKDNFKWDTHINGMVNKANKRLGLVKRSIGHKCDTNVKLLSYTALVRPILEYCSPLWTSNSKKNVIKLEGVQRRASKYILNDYVSNYYDRLIRCNLLPLTLRRDFLDYVLFYNYCNNLVDMRMNIEFVSNINMRTRVLLDNNMLICKPVNTWAYNNYFTNRIVRSWNELPEDIRTIELTAAGRNTTFKTMVKKWLTAYFKSNFKVDNTCSWCIKCHCTNCILT
jgi:hypothetical protein